MSRWDTLFYTHWIITAAEFSQRIMPGSCLGAGSRAGNPWSALNEILATTSFILACDSYVTKWYQQRHTRTLCLHDLLFQEMTSRLLGGKPPAYFPVQWLLILSKFQWIPCLPPICNIWKKCHIFFFLHQFISWKNCTVFGALWTSVKE